MKIQFGFDDSDQSVETSIKEHVIWKNEIVIGAVRQEVIGNSDNHQFEGLTK
jgi:hypothetical protein